MIGQIPLSKGLIIPIVFKKTYLKKLEVKPLKNHFYILNNYKHCIFNILACYNPEL